MIAYVTVTSRMPTCAYACSISYSTMHTFMHVLFILYMCDCVCMHANAYLSPRGCPRMHALVIFIFYLQDVSVYVQKMSICDM